MIFASIAEIKVYEASGSECDMYVLRWLLHVHALLFFSEISTAASDSVSELFRFDTTIRATKGSCTSFVILVSLKAF